MNSENSYQLYIAMFSVHGLIRSDNLELGRDADTGGQTKYVVELTKALSERSEVARVDLFTRQILDRKVDSIYGEPVEPLTQKANIIRMACGPRRYLRKEVLWPYLDEFADRALRHFRTIGRMPDLLHAHYADAGYVATKLSNLLGIPLIYTGHSLGRVKYQRLLDKGMPPERIAQHYNIHKRIEAEEETLSTAVMVVASTHQEIGAQYKLYERYQPDRMKVIPPGIDLGRFHPPRGSNWDSEFYRELMRFLRDPRRPMILALSRADERKNIATLVQAYAEHPRLRHQANLVVIAGTRDDILTMESESREVLKHLFYLIDKYDLYGSVAYPKKHLPEQVPEIYRIAAKTHGVFVNPALTEPFGLTLLEASASGLPIVATNDGGPIDIIRNCRNGRSIDPLNATEMANAIECTLMHRSDWRRLSRNGLHGVKRHYSWDGHVRSYSQYVRKYALPKKTPPFWISTGKKLLKVDRLLIADIDNTLLGDERALTELITKINNCPVHIGFSIATGRKLQSTLDVLKLHDVPIPDVLITSVGSEINYGQNLTPDTNWKKHIHYKWEPDRLRECIAPLPGISLQSEEDQREHKVSYFINPEKAPPLREIIRLIRSKRLAVKVIYSHQQYLDFLPQRASKGLAVWYLSNRWGIPMERIMVAGDSGNDEEMLNGNVLGVVVGNYSPELESLRNNPRIYFAKDCYAAGILEGIEHYRFLDDHFTEEEQDS